MTYKLPFGLKQKPLNKYIMHGVIKFSCREGMLHFEVRQITKDVNGTIYRGIVKSKQHLEQLLAVKTLNEIQTIEVVT